ncbi:MAG: arsenate reductase (thioredoxin) [Flavobacteriales bacterium]|nr:arsenate reductase (thioredoxin) [Flavobacteriales bacterium]
MKKIVFLCTGNSCRSQMAEGFARALLRGQDAIVDSAGVQADGLNPLATKVMSEVGIDIQSQKSKTIKSLDLNQFELIVTVCDNARDNCPLFNHRKIIHKNFDDPAVSEGPIEEQLVVYRKIRDQIEIMVKAVIKDMI